MGAVDPKVVAVFVQYERLGPGQLPGEPPLPLGHDRLGGADDAQYIVAFGRHLCEQPCAACTATAVVDHTEDPGVFTQGFWLPAVAGEEVDHNIFVIAVNAGNQAFKQVS